LAKGFTFGYHFLAATYRCGEGDPSSDKEEKR
jgi:hypothetical protein